MELEFLPELPNEIIEAYEERRLVLFVGAGISRLTGCQSWIGMAKNLVSKVFSRSDANQILEGNYGGKELISMAYEEARLNGKIDDYWACFKKAISSDSQKQQVYTNIARLETFIVTTNCDDALDKYFGTDSITTDCSKTRLQNVKEPYRLYGKFVHRFRLPNFFSLPSRDNYALAFVMNGRDLWEYKKLGIIPIILDSPSWTVREVYEMTKRLPAFWVTSLDYYELMKKEYPDAKAHYFPLSVAAKWAHGFNDFESTEYDVIQMGRKNSMLHNWMLKYCESHSEINYVYQESRDNVRHYFSTKEGKLNSSFSATRESYMGAMRKSKVCLVSSPNVDDQAKFGTIDFPTPRFYEAAICGCQLIGRYSNKREFQNVGICSICPNVDSYEAFRIELDKALKKPREMSLDQKQFILENTTEMRVKKFKEEMEELL